MLGAAWLAPVQPAALLAGGREQAGIALEHPAGVLVLWGSTTVLCGWLVLVEQAAQDGSARDPLGWCGRDRVLGSRWS